MLNKRIAIVTIVMALCASGTAAIAQDVRQEKNMSLTLAYEAATAAMQFCAEKGWNVSVAVVDRAGQLKALLRADGAGPHTIDASRRKAFTSASARNNTSAILENVQKNPGAANLQLIDGFLVLGGGMPIRVGDEVIGAIGVGGAPGGHLDDQCAEAGINKIRDRLK
ncbi:MAG: heme-binding protein [Nitrospirae bacterium]|nr:heme-binding protein [Nitrospirota bacterium]